MKQKSPMLKKNGVQSLISSLLCIILGLVVGYLALLIINAEGAGQAIISVVKDFFNRSSAPMRMKYLGNTLAKTAPLLMCSLSVLFAYKVGLFNIGVAGQYSLGAAVALFCALYLDMPWWVCLLAAIVAGALSAALCGVLRSYCNVNVVISGIMLNWISLYGANMLLVLDGVKEPTGKDTIRLAMGHKGAILPTLGLDSLFNKNQYVTIGIPIAIVVSILVWIVLNKTKLGYELKATGNNLHAAKYCGMKENRNIILTMVIAGGLAGMGAGLFYLADFEQWNVYASSVPAMGFNGIAAAFLGGLNPIGAIFSSYFIQHITSGGAYVDLSHYCAQISDFISAVIIYLCGFVLFFKGFMNKIVDKRAEKRAAKENALAESNAKGGNK